MVYQPPMKLGWYVNRLRSMEPAEVVHRLREAGRKRASSARHEGWARYPAEPLRTVFPHWPERIRTATQEQRAAIEAAAKRALHGEFAALGRTWPARDSADLFPAAAWRLDPVSGTDWPAGAYCFDIDFRHEPGRGDVKYVWEFNRLQDLPVLAAFAVLENNLPAVAAIETAIQSWHTANPPFRGVGWASGIEVALRAISLIAVHSLVGDRLTRGVEGCIAEILSASAFWLPRFPSLHSSANNHRVAELAGEALIAHALGNDPSPAERELAREIALQILPDGASAEQTPTYGAFTAELVLLCLDAVRQGGGDLPDVVQQRLAAFADFVNAIGAARFGDDDEGRAITLGDEPDYAASVASAIDGALGRPGLPVSDFRALLFARPKAEARAQGLITFPDGGLAIWRGSLAGRNVDFTFDYGPLGYLSIAAHGHADALAIALSIDGLPVLVDPGTYLYGSGGAWRSWFRSTPAHNTLNIDSESQSVMSGAFNWSHKAHAALIESHSQPDWRVRAKQDGYVRRFGATHERTVSCGRDEIVVSDRLLGAAHEAEIVFQLAPGLEAERNGRTLTVRAGEDRLLAIKLPEGAIAVTTGGDSPAGGWVSPRFGVKVPATRVAWRGPVDAEGVVTRLLVLPRS